MSSLEYLNTKPKFIGPNNEMKQWILDLDLTL